MKGYKDGFNIYRNGTFVMSIQGDSETRAINWVTSYVKSNNLNINHFSIKQFINHASTMEELYLSKMNL